MPSPDRGPLLYSYYPIPANPMTVALLLLVGLVTFVLGPIAARPDFWPLGGLCFVPFALVVLSLVAFKPSPTYLHEEGIQVSRPLWRRLLGTKAYFEWRELRDVYPRSYEVAGSFLSPFASSAGTLVHTGIGIETRAGKRILVRFTPASIRGFRAESQGFTDAMATIRARFARRGEPMVTTARTYADEDVLRMQEVARAPLVSIEGVFLAFFLPPAIVAAVLVVASALGAPLSLPVVVAAVGFALVPPAASMLRTLRQSERRNEILSELAKFQEHLRERPTDVEAATSRASPE